MLANRTMYKPMVTIMDSDFRKMVTDNIGSCMRNSAREYFCKDASLSADVFISHGFSSTDKFQDLFARIIPVFSNSKTAFDELQMCFLQKGRMPLLRVPLSAETEALAKSDHILVEKLEKVHRGLYGE